MSSTEHSKKNGQTIRMREAVILDTDGKKQVCRDIFMDLEDDRIAFEKASKKFCIS